ncbi:hypothetical protein LCGC14_1687870, partial [marine sediment metagenome]
MAKEPLAERDPGMMSADYDKIICIDDWKPDDSSYDKGYYPEGTREKAVYFSPADVGNLPLRPGWRYLFKKSRTWTPWQFWMEIMAYRIGQVMDVPVPRAYVGLSNLEKPGQAVYGALIEWFYSRDERYIEGARLIGPHIPDFDYKTGRQHNLQTILSILTPKEVPDPEENRRRLVAHWAAVLAFDTVIGNVDRHPENWGIVVTPPGSAKELVKVGLSPAFDNGTAMSYEQPEEHFHKFEDAGYARRYLTRVRRARHHMRWSLEDQADMNFFDFMQRFVRQFPETRDSVIGRLKFAEAD